MAPSGKCVFNVPPGLKFPPQKKNDYSPDPPFNSFFSAARRLGEPYLAADDAPALRPAAPPLRRRRQSPRPVPRDTGPRQVVRRLQRPKGRARHLLQGTSEDLALLLKFFVLQEEKEMKRRENFEKAKQFKAFQKQQQQLLQQQST